MGSENVIVQFIALQVMLFSLISGRYGRQTDGDNESSLQHIYFSCSVVI
jgi:hypothetical protein